ncbi:MAG: hypothetical protein V3T54_04615 [Acidobacteriota bacterium]
MDRAKREAGTELMSHRDTRVILSGQDFLSLMRSLLGGLLILAQKLWVSSHVGDESSGR